VVQCVAVVVSFLSVIIDSYMQVTRLIHATLTHVCVLQCDAVCCSVLQRVAVRCSTLQCVAVVMILLVIIVDSYMQVT